MSFSLTTTVSTSHTTVGYIDSSNAESSRYSVTSRLKTETRIKGTSEWTDVIYANIGDEVEFKIEYVNLLSDRVDDVTIRDVLPTNMEYIPDSTYLFCIMRLFRTASE